jgi:hypothetical protein
MIRWSPISNAAYCISERRLSIFVIRQLHIDAYISGGLGLFAMDRLFDAITFSIPLPRAKLRSHEREHYRPCHWRQIMAAAQFSLPKQWEDWCNWLLGIWLCISPWALRFDLEPTATRTAVITGVLIILVEVVTLSVYRAWEEWINVILGAWLVLCPWLLGISFSVAIANLVVVGLLVMALAFYEIWEMRSQTPSSRP